LSKVSSNKYVGVVCSVVVALGLVLTGASAGATVRDSGFESSPEVSTTWSVETTPKLTVSGAASYDFASVSCPTTADCEAVGGYSNEDLDAGGLLIEKWNGKSWAIQATNTSGGGLEGVSCVSVSYCIAVGSASESGGAAAEVFKGTWRTLTMPSGSGALEAVSCTSSSACMAVGEGSSLTWNGSSWRTHSLPSTSDDLTGVSCTASMQCTAVGSSTTGMLAAVWNGTKWSTQKVPAPKGSTISELNSLSCSSKSFCVAAGITSLGTEGLFLAERWNGKTWSVAHLAAPPQPADNLTGISCTSTTSCVAVGLDGSSALSEIWNGTTWTIKSLPVPKDESYSPAPLALSCKSATSCTSVGAYGVTVDGEGDLRPLVDRLS
jgi:hypothetical protein